MSYILYHKYIELLPHSPEIIHQNLIFLDYYFAKYQPRDIYDGIIIVVIKKELIFQKPSS